MNTRRIFHWLPLFALAGLSLFLIAAQEQPGTPSEPQPPSGRPHPLTWDKMEKDYTLDDGETKGHFSFWVTNTSKMNVIISSVNPSCGCTVADYPKPWNLAPGESGEVKASMDVAGKSGTQVKTMTVISTGGPSQVLTMKVLMPDLNEERRKANMAAAAKNRQVVFQGDCASCHVEPLKGKLGKDLFVAGCNICHEPPHGAKRAEIVPDLNKIAHPTDKVWWKQMIADGRPNTLMPGFAKAHGGPLTDEEIESLADYAVKTFKFDPANAKKTN